MPQLNLTGRPAKVRQPLALPSSMLSVAAVFAFGALMPFRAARSVGPVNVSFKMQVQPIFNDYCVTCHQQGSAQGGLVLEEGYAYAKLVGRLSGEAKLALVTPGVPSEGYLLHKLNGSQISVGGNGARMPLAGELDTPSIDLIRAWITGGAKDN